MVKSVFVLAVCGIAGVLGASVSGSPSVVNEQSPEMTVSCCFFTLDKNDPGYLKYPTEHRVRVTPKAGCAYWEAVCWNNYLTAKANQELITDLDIILNCKGSCAGSGMYLCTCIDMNRLTHETKLDNFYATYLNCAGNCP